MIVTVHQPEHMPWLGYFNKCSKADVLVHLDSVQFEKNNFQNRNRILVNNKATWLTVPVSLKGHMNSKISDIEISDIPWKAKYLKTIEFAYARAPYFKEYYPAIKEIISKDEVKIARLNIALIDYFLDILDINVKTIKSSEMNLPETDASHNLLNIMQKTGGDEYLSGPSGEGYLDESIFKNCGIDVSYNHFNHPQYEQRNATEFVSHLSVLDALFSFGANSTKEIILKG